MGHHEYGNRRLGQGLFLPRRAPADPVGVRFVLAPASGAGPFSEHRPHHRGHGLDHGVILQGGRGERPGQGEQ